MKFFFLLFLSFTLMGKELPKNLKWETNMDEPVWSSPEAKRGGTFTGYLETFPLTLRYMGPDSNGGFRSYIYDVSLIKLADFHPNTKKMIPLAATHWAFDQDGKTIYFKLDPDQKWSDGKAVSADDYVYTRELMLSKYIVDPWANENYTKMILDISKYDDHTISITYSTALPKTELLYGLGSMVPTPRHFYKLSANFIKDYDWKKPLTTGPYYLDKVEKGKSLTFKRIDKWWGDEKKYFKNRNNMDKYVLNIIRDTNIAYQHFLKGNLDTFWLQRPEWWHDRAKGEEYDKGYIHKLWFYTDGHVSDYYIVLNTKSPPLDDINVRIALSHAINVDKVSNTILRGDYERINTTMDGYGEYTNPNVKARPYDPKKVDEYLKKSGWEKRGADGIRTKNGQKLSVTLTYGTKAMEPRLVVFKEEAKKVGIELNLNLMDGSAAFKSAKEKQHQMFYTAWAGDVFPVYWEFWHGDNAKPNTNNFSNLTNAKLDKLIDEQRFTQDEKKRKELSREIQQIIHDEAVAIHLWNSPYFREAYWPWVKFPEVQGTRLAESAPLDQFIFNTANSIFWIDEGLKKEVLAAKKAGKKYSDPVVIINKTFKK